MHKEARAHAAPTQRLDVQRAARCLAAARSLLQADDAAHPAALAGCSKQRCCAKATTGSCACAIVTSMYVISFERSGTRRVSLARGRSASSSGTRPIEHEWARPRASCAATTILLLSFPLKLKGRMDILKGTLSYFKPRRRRSRGAEGGRSPIFGQKAESLARGQIGTSHCRCERRVGRTAHARRAH